MSNISHDTANIGPVLFVCLFFHLQCYINSSYVTLKKQRHDAHICGNGNTTRPWNTKHEILSTCFELRDFHFVKFCFCFEGTSSLNLVSVCRSIEIETRHGSMDVFMPTKGTFSCEYLEFTRIISGFKLKDYRELE